MVYRGSPTQKPRRARGNVIDEMVSQFADRYAFVRELVQNSIDAGASRVAVHVEAAEGRTRTSVEDDGSGMTLEIIEGPLVTLFSSSKEGQEGKIGRYGVGFMSVFALDPTEVEVDTRTAEGHYLVRIFRDQSYEITELPPRDGTGTIVTLIIDGEDSGEHESRVEAAIVRWCRHVRVPVELDTGGHVRSRCQPFELVAPIVLAADKDGVSVVVGLSAGTEAIPTNGEPPEGRGDYAGFFARGLTLHETTDRALVVPGVRFKVESAGLAHTLSRDNVRRDAAYERAMRMVHSLARNLNDALIGALRESAERLATGADEPLYEARLRAGAARLSPSDITLALVVPMGGRHTMALDAILRADPVVHFGGAPCDASRALAARGVPVIQSSSERTSEFFPGRTRSVVDVALADQLDNASIDPSDRALFHWIGKALAIVAGTSAPVVFARFRQSPGQERLPLVMRDVEGANPPWTSIPRGRDPVARLGRRTLEDATLVVNAYSGVLSRARKLAARAMATRPAEGRVGAIAAVAAIVVRLVHLEHVGAVERDGNEALLELVAEAQHAR